MKMNRKLEEDLAKSYKVDKDDYFLVNFDHFWIKGNFLRQMGR